MDINSPKISSEFVIFDVRFQQLLGAEPSLELLLEHHEYPIAHEAGVYLPSTDEIFITSNQFFNSSGRRQVRISKVSFEDESKKPSREKIFPSDEILMANGGVNFKDGIIFCAQGSQTQPSGLYFMSTSSTYTSTVLISLFYGRQFNFVNDVVVHSDGSIWFTDPIYGYEQGYRPKPELPNQVYRFDPVSKGIRDMVDGFGRPNGIAFSPDEKTVYVTDTDGNVYSGCGDGINVWCPGGVLLGIIKVEVEAANFCFGREGSLHILNENRIWQAQLAKSVKGALLRI